MTEEDFLSQVELGRRLLSPPPTAETRRAGECPLLTREETDLKAHWTFLKLDIDVDLDIWISEVRGIVRAEEVIHCMSTDNQFAVFLSATNELLLKVSSRAGLNVVALQTSICSHILQLGHARRQGRQGGAEQEAWLVAS